MNGTRLARLIEQLGREMARLGLRAVNVRYKDRGTLQAEVVADRRAAKGSPMAVAKFKASTRVGHVRPTRPRGRAL